MPSLMWRSVDFSFVHSKEFLGASPDGMRYCECHGCGCIEIKCLSSKAESTIEECLQDPNFCLERSPDGVGVSLKENHTSTLRYKYRYLSLKLRTVISSFGHQGTWSCLELTPTMTFGQTSCQSWSISLLWPSCRNLWGVFIHDHVHSLFPLPNVALHHRHQLLNHTATANVEKRRTTWWLVTMKTVNCSGFTFYAWESKEHQKAIGTARIAGRCQSSDDGGK